MPKATFFVAYAQFQPILLQYWQSGDNPPPRPVQLKLLSHQELS
jgi:hypothetical protein